MGVGGLGVRPGKAGRGPTTRGLGSKARELGIVLGIVVASGVLSGREECPCVSCVLGR